MSKFQKNQKRVLQYQGLFFMLEIICFEIINMYYNDFLENYFKIKNIRELVIKKCFQLTLKKDIEAYIKICDLYMISKIVKHKFYEDFQPFSKPIYHQKNVLIDFISNLSVLSNQKETVKINV